MNRDQFLKERMRGIGGSDAPALLGLSTRKTPLEIYLQKRGELAEEPDNAAMRAGRMLEPVVRQMYAEDTGRIVTQPKDMIVHAKHGFMIGHPDGLIPAERRLYEGKTARSDYGWGAPGTDEIPHEYVIQVQHYLCITGYEVADVGVLIAGSDFRIYEVPADRELQESIIEAEANFWPLVTRGEPPEPDWNAPHALRAVMALYPGTNGETLTATLEQEERRRVLEDAARRASIADSVVEGTKAMLLWDMGEAAVLKFSDGKVLRRKLTKRKGYEVAPTEFMDCRIAKDKE